MEEAIRNTFYNLFFDVASGLFSTNFTMNRSNCLAVICTSVVEVLENSKDVGDEIVLHNHQRISQENCPEMFTDFFIALIQLKHLLSTTSTHAYFDRLRKAILCRFGLSDEEARLAKDPRVNEVVDLAKKIYRNENFQQIIVHVGDLFQSVQTHKVSETLIKETFYNIMLECAIDGKVPHDDIEMTEAYIFLDMSALTIINACYQCRDMGALRLLDGSTLDSTNCPDIYMGFIEIFEKIKPAFKHLTPGQIRDLELICSANPAVEVADNIKTHELTQLAANINQIATKVSQLASFKQIINDVIRFYLEMHIDS